MSEELNEELKRLKEDERYIKGLREKIRQIDYKVSKEFIEKAIKFSKENELNYAYPWLMDSLAWTYFYLADFTKVISIGEEAYKIFEENNDLEGCLAIICPLMASYSIQNNFDLAIECGLRGIEFAQLTGNYKGLTSIKTNMVSIYIDMGEYEKGKEILEQLENLSYTTNKEIEICNYINRTICETKTNNLDKAMEFINEAYKLANKYMLKNIPDILKEMGNIYVEKGLYEIAEEKFKKSLIIAEKYGNYIYIADILLCLAELDLLKGKYEDSIGKVKRIFTYIDDINSRRELKRAYSNMSKAFKGLKDYEKAYFYLEKYWDIEKEISNMSSSASIKSLDKKKEEEESRIYKLLYNQMEILYSVGQRITANLDRKNIFNIIAKEIESLIKLDGFQVGLYKEDGGFKYQLCLDQGTRIEIESTRLIENTFAEYSINNNKDIFINDIEKEYYIYIEKFDDYVGEIKKTQREGLERLSQSAMFVPIRLNNKIIGLISTQSYAKNAYKLKDLNTLKILSTYIAIALENARLYEEFEYSANYDTLTNILNRRESLKRSRELFEKNELKNENIAIIMIDADNFKEINDTYGHQIGDKILMEIASTIKSSVKESDIVGRYGGEEFIVVINNESYENIVKISEKIRGGVERINVKSELGKEINVTVSLGIVEKSCRFKSLEQIINLADKALYKAKNTGKNKVVFD